ADRHPYGEQPAFHELEQLAERVEPTAIAPCDVLDVTSNLPTARVRAGLELDQKAPLCCHVRFPPFPLRARRSFGSLRVVAPLTVDRSVRYREPIGRSMTAPATKTKQPPRDKILDCAEALFARRGFAGTGLAEVAETVGLGKSSLFHHFPSKAELYAAVVARILARIEGRLMRALA